MQCLKVILAVSMAAALAASFCGCGSASSERNAKREISSEDSAVSSESNSAANEDNGETESSSDVTSTADGETNVPEAVNESFDEKENEETESVGEEEKNIRYEKLVEIVSNSGAAGYTIGHIGGSDNYFLMLSFGDVEASRYYDVYRIDKDDVVLVQSMLVGSHTAAYVAENTGNLAIYQAHMGHYGYGDLVYTDGGVSIDWLEDNGVIGDDEDYPPIPGEIITFTPINDFGLLDDF